MLKGANNIKCMTDAPRSLSRQKTDSRAGGRVDELDFRVRQTVFHGKWERLKAWVLMEIHFMGGFGLLG